MWLMKVLLFVCAVGFLDSYAGPKDYGLKVYRHVITVSEISVEKPMPGPFPQEEEEAVARDI